MRERPELTGSAIREARKYGGRRKGRSIRPSMTNAMRSAIPAIIRNRVSEYLRRIRRFLCCAPAKVVGTRRRLLIDIAQPNCAAYTSF
jgi:hypothetical protein